MSNRTIKHGIKLQPSVIILLGLLALGVCTYAFSPIFSVKKADAAYGGGDEMIVSMLMPQQTQHEKTFTSW